MYHIICFAWFGERCFLCTVTEDAVPDTFIFSFKTPLFEKGFTFGSIENLFGPVYPAVPASILQLHPDVTVVADEAALQVIREREAL